MFDQKQRGDHDRELDDQLDAEPRLDARVPPGKRSRLDARYRDDQSLGAPRVRMLVERGLAAAGAPVPGRAALAPPLAADIRRSASGDPVSGDAARLLAAASGQAGQPLPPWLRARFERALRVDLTRVRVHIGPAAAAAARAMGARAFAHGQDIYFAEGRFQPDSEAGVRLLAHEVAHTAQTGPAGGTPRLTEPGDALENDADQAADAMVAGTQARVAPGDAAAIGRDNETRTDLTEDMLDVISFELAPPNGATRAVPNGEIDGQVMIQAGEIQFNADVGLKSTFNIGPGQTVQVGAIQTLMGSMRRAIYRNPDGSVAAEYSSPVGMSRDAPDQNEGRPVPEPWYWQPRDISDNARQAHVQFMDRPRWNLARRLGDSEATLTETTGEENFVTSLAAKRDGTILHLRRMQWSVPWAMQITPDGSGAGGATTAGSTTRTPTPMSSPLPGDQSREIYHFTDVAAARAVGWRTLLTMTDAARTADPTSYGFMIEALRDLNPTFAATIRCVREYSTVGADSVTLTATGHHSVSRSFSLRQNGTGTLSFRFLDVFDVNRANDGIALNFSASVGGVLTTMECTAGPWHYSFEAQNNINMAGSERSYQISAAADAAVADAGGAGAGAATMAPGGGVRRKTSGDPISPDAAARLAAARGGSGQPLPEGLRGRFERTLGTDLGDVRVHTGGSADAAARALGARAFAHGRDIYFADGGYQPDSEAGQHLLAHEVAHTAQAPTAGDPQLTSPGDAVEHDADRAADAMIAGGETRVA
ncbi:MAG TPA: DUF4157 domain-containing protein, partial [Kofleriaceae bacterium]|nr:DUF4157 domain-containing protein [Kofleriaceae bacterium]